MITQKRCTVPIFNYQLTIIIFDNWEELKPYIPIEEYEHEAKALVLHDYGRSRVFVTPQYKESIIHESLHIKNAIWRFIGYTPQPDNDEVDAYLITYIYQKIYKVYEEHCK